MVKVGYLLLYCKKIRLVRAQNTAFQNSHESPRELIKIQILIQLVQGGADILYLKMLSSNADVSSNPAFCSKNINY